MPERKVSLTHRRIMRWVKCFTPEFSRRWNRFATATGQSWPVDETYVTIRGKWVHRHRVVDRIGKTFDFRRAARRDVSGASARQYREVDEFLADSI